jgi:NADH dehydrogenase FAD-containing subunit
MAVRELAKLKVKVMTNTHVVDAAATPAGKQSLALQTTGKNKNNKTDTDTATTTLETDLYIPTFGVRPNTAFVPAAMLDADDRVKVDRDTLQATSYANVFALGDASNAQTANGKHADAQVRFLAPAMRNRLAGCTMPTYKADDTFVFAVTLGPYRGTGQIGNWRLWGWIIRITIGKHMGTDYAPEIAAGNRTMTETKW